MKIAIFCPNWVGDLVMATPALRAMRNHFHDAEIVGVMRPYLTDLLEGTGLLDRTLSHDPRGSNPAHRGWALVRQLRMERFDLGVLLPNSFRSGLLARAGGIRRRVGFARDVRKWLLTDALKPKSRKTPHPAIDEYLRLAAHLRCGREAGSSDGNLPRTMELATSIEHEQQFSRWLRRIGQGGETSGIVCLNPGGAFGSSKHWSVSSFAQLGRRIAGELHKRVVVLCGPAEREEAREIAKQAQHPWVFSLADEHPSLGLTKAAVRRADLLVTTDSGPRHFAAPFGVPVVTLFGPTHIAWSETYYDKAVHLQLDLDCGPCQQRICPLGHHRCMQELRVDDVFNAADKLLKRYSSPAAA